MLNSDDPRSIGGYRLIDRLGSGGMGVVYRARSRSGRQVAVKVVHAQYAGDAVFRTRFRQEIDAVRKVSGVFTAPVVDADPEAVRPWMATQYVPGPSLADRVRAGGPLRGAELRRLVLGLVEALRDIHRVGVVHRDLKPANVLMAEDGPRVIDFGISRAAENQTLTETGHLIGTPPFMSPEQLTDSRSVGPASDVFSLGSLVVFAVTGRGPFDADSPFVAAYQVMNDAPALDAVPEPLRGIVARCLAKEPAERPGLDALAAEFADALPEPDPGDPVTLALRGSVPTAPDVVRRPRRRRPLLAVAATAGTLVVALLAYLLIGRPDGTERTGAPAPPSTPSPSASARYEPVPDGWRPWQTTAYAPAPGGGRIRLDGGEEDATGSGVTCELGGDAVYCAGNGVLPVRIDALTGETDWRADVAPAGVEVNDFNARIVGVADGVVLVERSISGPDGETLSGDAIALDAERGEQLWTRSLGTDYGGYLELSGSVALVLSDDAGSVTAVTPRKGTRLWTARLPEGYYCSLLGAGDRPFADCVAAAEDSDEVLLVAFDPADGRTRTFPMTHFRDAELGVVDGRMLLAHYREGGSGLEYTGLTTLDLDTGASRVTRLAKTYLGEPVLAHGTLYFITSTGLVTAVSPDTGEQLWQTRTTLDLLAALVVDRRGRTAYVASESGRVAALDTRSGTRLWESYSRVEQLAGTGTWPGLSLNGGALVVAVSDGTVFTLDPAAPEREPVPVPT
ncbi:protein kinase domain-containing protein [Streptomyces flavalbus]|uniref:PQQ-binding-like beta-propeller repeat protein n=1 Tax=Streptomyces flavalbus TaxID=2665155 RepID=A0ABW2W5Q0_9ACTN